jgi:hypothetical protein
VWQIVDELKRIFGADSVFCDALSVDGASRWDHEIDKALSSCQVLIVIIDEHWDNAKLHDPGDWVRREIQAGLTGRCSILPILIDGATMPSSSHLPTDIAALAAHQGMFVATRSREILVATIGIAAGRIVELAPCYLSLHRLIADLPFSARRIEQNDWILYCDGQAAVNLTGTMETAETLTTTGSHSLWASWSERELRIIPDRSHGEYSSYGTTAKITVSIGPGRHVFKMTKNSPTSWQKVGRFFGFDSASRSLNLISVDSSKHA